MTTHTSEQAAYEAAHPNPDGFVDWEFLPPEAHAHWTRIAQAAIAAHFGSGAGTLTALPADRGDIPESATTKPQAAHAEVMHLMTIDMRAWCGASGPGNGRASSQWRDVTCPACTAKGMDWLRALVWDMLQVLPPSRTALDLAVRAGRLGVRDDQDRPLAMWCTDQAAITAQSRPATGGHDIAQLLDRISVLAGALHEIKTAYTSGTQAHDTAHEALDQSAIIAAQEPQPAPDLPARAAVIGSPLYAELAAQLSEALAERDELRELRELLGEVLAQFRDPGATFSAKQTRDRVAHLTQANIARIRKRAGLEE